MFKELMLRRKKKILNLVFIAAETGVSRRDFENMLGFEKNLFEKIMDAMNASEKDVNALMDSSSNPEESRKEPSRMVVFKEGLDAFLDLTGEKIGPFEQGEIANLSGEIAKILVNEKKAEYVEEE
jgi:hypothetical protein